MPREPSKGDPRSTFKKVHSLNRIGDRARTRTQRQLAADVEPKKNSQNLPVHLHAHKSKQREGARDATLPGGDGVGDTASSQVTPFWGIVSPPRSSPPFHFEITLSERDADFVVTNGRESVEG
ncbi:hypothetical protein CDEST_08907 [Colletotrichum destructivum]|uniref:Uncharacterized protein n=1 Tax=Colletotrichum destructivum TaxID=34406 RepID=A0AAX4ILK8_9PEZI|nr:hypothetical protein CDEST_08907 [Colletotrichum destructivum]